MTHPLFVVRLSLLSAMVDFSLSQLISMVVQSSSNTLLLMHVLFTESDNEELQTSSTAELS